METLKQCPTPLNTLYFSAFNVNLVQRAVRANVKKMTGVSIDYQNSGDLFALMRVVFISNSSNPYADTCTQVRQMNEIAIKQATSQVITGLSQYMGYLRDASSTLNLMNLPQNTSSAGTGMGENKVGLLGQGAQAIESAYNTVASGTVKAYNVVASGSVSAAKTVASGSVTAAKAVKNFF